MSTRILAHRRGDDRLLEIPLTSVRDVLEDPEAFVWVSLDSSDADTEKLLVDVFALHPMVLEDLFQDKDRPKVEDFGTYLYVIVHGMDRDAETPTELRLLELDLLLGQRFLVTHHTKPMRSITAVEEEIRRNPRILQRGPAFVAYSILDHLTDHFVPVMDRFDEEIEALEHEIMGEPKPSQLQQIFALKRSLQYLRRVSTYQRDTLHRLARGEFECIPQSALPFYRDVYDHFVRIADLTESYRDSVSAALEAYLSMQSNKLNEIMKVLTLMSTMMLPLTFIAGVYGMNFKVMPEIEWTFGYPYALALMAAVAIGLFLYFRRRRWL